MKFILLLLFSYLCGSVPFGKLLGRLQGVDIQKRGSGNIGFANVRRVLGWRYGLLTLLGDILKGALPTLLTLQLLGHTAAFVVGLAAIAGHIFPVWLKFRGGKGIATGLGVVIVLVPLAAAIGGLVYVIGCLLLRNSALSSLLGVAAVLTTGIVLQPSAWWQYVILLAITCFTLRKNILGKVPNYDI